MKSKLAERTVLCVLHGDEAGGASLSVLRVAPALAELGWRFVFWAPSPSALANEVAARGFEVHGAPSPTVGYSLAALRVSPGIAQRLSRIPRYYATFAQTVRALKPDLCHCNSMYTVDEAAVAKAMGVPVVMHVHEMVGDSLKHRIARRTIQALGNVTVGVSAASVASLSVGHSNALLVHEATDIAPFSKERPLRRGHTVVGSIGVIAPRKGTDTFVQASKLVRKCAQDVEFRLVGAPTDPLHAAWAEKVLMDANEAGIPYAESADVADVLADWDIFVLPSRVDPFPIVVLEAMASGLPVVGTNVDGLAEQVTPETGLLVEPDNPDLLAKAVLKLHREPELRNALGAGGRLRVEKNFSIPRQAQGLDAAYRLALEEA